MPNFLDLIRGRPSTVNKFNPYHDPADGQFTSGPGGGGGVGQPMALTPEGHLPGEFEALFEIHTAPGPAPTSPALTRRQTTVARPGVTRAQQERYFARREAIQRAMTFRYQGGVTSKQFVDGYLAEGFGGPEEGRMGRLILYHRAKGEDMTFQKQDADYARVVFNMGKFARNY